MYPHQFHRDFLNPLLPVYAYEYEELAPHCLSYEDLEVDVLSSSILSQTDFMFFFAHRKTSQRDILAAFAYSLGTTPQAVLDELWVALPSLQQLFDYHGGWSSVMKEIWWRLFEAVLGKAFSHFSMTLLAIFLCLV